MPGRFVVAGAFAEEVWLLQRCGGCGGFEMVEDGYVGPGEIKDVDVRLDA